MLDMKEQDDQVIATLSGELTIQNAEPLKSSLLECLAPGKDLTLDLAGVSELDSAGVQLLYYAKQAARERNLSLRLQHHSPAVVEVFELYRLAPVFGDPMVLDGARNTDDNARSGAHS